MKHLLVAVALLAACRGKHRAVPRDAGRDGPAMSVSVPKLPVSDDGVAAMRVLDKKIEIHASEPATLLQLLLERAAFRGQLEDYQRALDVSAALVAGAPKDPQAQLMRVQALTRVHEF